ncbi:MAG: hypothetical protein WB680_16920 [Candidatus Acidiferrales bacterium]
MKPCCSLIAAVLSIPLLASTLASPQLNPDDQLVSEKLLSLSSSNNGSPVDCGNTAMFKPDEKLTACINAAFAEHKPFHALYSGPVRFFQSAYGLAGDANGNVYEVLYDSRKLLNLGLGKTSQVFDDNLIRVTTCVKPVRLGQTSDGMLACITPVDEQASQLAAQQQPIDTTVCAILAHPAAFNNKMVRIHGYFFETFESSDLGSDGCSASMWFAYGNGEGPPGLVAYVNGGATPGAEDAEGKLILPIPVKLVQDASFRRFERLVKAGAKADALSEKRNPDSIDFHRVSATFIGRIDGVSDDVHAFHLKRKPTDRADFLGFGQMGLFDAQFVMQSVENDAVLETFPPTPQPASNQSPKSH